MKKNMKQLYGLLGSACLGLIALNAEMVLPEPDSQMRVKSVESIASVLKAEVPVEEPKKEPVIVFNIPIRRYHEKIANEKMRSAPVVTDMGEVIEEKDGVTFHLRHKQDALAAPYDAQAAFVSYEDLDGAMQQQAYVRVMSVIKNMAPSAELSTWLKQKANEGHVVAMFELVRDILSNQLEQVELRDTVVAQEDKLFMSWVNRVPQAQMDEANKQLSDLTKQFGEKDSKKIEEAFFWFVLGLTRTEQDAACCLDTSVAAARDALAYSYGSRLFEKVNGQLEAVRLQVIDWLAGHDSNAFPSPEWVKYHGMQVFSSFLNGTPKPLASDMHPQDEWKRLRDTAAKTYLMIADETKQVTE